MDLHHPGTRPAHILPSLSAGGKQKVFQSPACLFSWETGSRMELNPTVAPQIPIPGMCCVTCGPGAEWGHGVSPVFQGLFIHLRREVLLDVGFAIRENEENILG